MNRAIPHRLLPHVALLSAASCLVSGMASGLAYADPPPAPSPSVAVSAPTEAPPPPPTPPFPTGAPSSAAAPAPSSGNSAAPPPGAPPAGGHWVYVADAPSAAGPATATPAPDPTKPQIRGPVYQHANTWDLNIDGAYGRFFGDEADKWTGFVRVRAGALFIREPLYNALGFTYEYSSLSKGTFGIQAEVLHLDLGVWGQLGGLLDVSGHPGAMAALGWSLFGVEAQVRSYDGLGQGIAIYAKVRIPVSIIARYFSTQRPPAPAAPPPEPPKP